MKSKDAFRTISEAAKEIGVPQHVLRHWEDVFGQVRPMRRAGGRRFYRTSDIELLIGIRTLLYEEKYSTKGVQKILKEHGIKHVAMIGSQIHSEDMAQTFEAEDQNKEGDNKESENASPRDTIDQTPVSDSNMEGTLHKNTCNDISSDLTHATGQQGVKTLLTLTSDEERKNEFLGIISRLLERIDVVQDQLDEAALAIEGAIAAFDDSPAHIAEDTSG